MREALVHQNVDALNRDNRMKTLLVLRPKNNKPTKILDKGLNKVSNYDAGILYKFETLRYSNLHTELKKILSVNTCFIVLGELTEYGAQLEANDDYGPRRKKKGQPTIQDRDGTEIVLDLDDHPIKGFDPLDPAPGITRWLKMNKISCDVTWQITSSQKLNAEEARIRLYFETDVPHTLLMRKAYSQSIKADGSVYTCMQPIFTAPPIIEGNGKDPIKKRHGFIKGRQKNFVLPEFTPEEVTKNCSIFRGGPSYDFNNTELPADVLNGSVYRRYFMPLAFHYVNLLSGDREAVFHIIKGLSLQVKSREFDPDNVYEYIDDAIEKIQEEASSYENSSPLLSDESGEKHEHTNLPEPRGGMRVLVQSALSMMRYPNNVIAQVTAEHAVSVFGGGIYHLNNINTTRKRVLIAQQGSGKSYVGAYMQSAVESLSKNAGTYVAEAWKYIGDDAFTFINQHINIEDHRVRSFILNEAGQSSKTRAGDQATFEAYQLDVLSKKADEVKLPKKYSAANGKESLSNTVYCGVWVYLHESVPGSYAEVLNSKGAIESGSNSRDDFFFVDSTIKNINRNSFRHKVEGDALKIISKLAAEFKGCNKTKGTDSTNRSVLKEIDYGDIEDSLEKLEDTIISERNRNQDDPIMMSILVRKYEKTVNYILLQALADYALYDDTDIPKATVNHFSIAVEREKAISEALLYQMRSGYLADYENRMIQSYIDSLNSKSLSGDTATRLGCQWSAQKKMYLVTKKYLTKISNNAPVKKYIQSVYRDNTNQARTAIIENLIGRDILIRRDGQTFYTNPKVASR